MAKSRAKVIVKGIVQGVNFRYYTQRQAVKYNINGWVKNLPDGSVGAVFEGEEHDVAAMVQWCRQGPPPPFASTSPPLKNATIVSRGCSLASRRS